MASEQQKLHLARAIARTVAREAYGVTLDEQAGMFVGFAVVALDKAERPRESIPARVLDCVTVALAELQAGQVQQ